MLTQERLKELLYYDYESGIIIWIASRFRYKPGMVAGAPHKGYVKITVDGSSYLAHRLAWLYSHGEWPKGQIDHINGIKNDNRMVNLRDVSSFVNQQNRKKPAINNKCGLRGVRRISDKKWESSIRANGRYFYLGLFDSKELAYVRYLSAKRKLHPESNS